jgi:hypothetical protein
LAEVYVCVDQRKGKDPPGLPRHEAFHEGNGVAQGDDVEDPFLDFAFGVPRPFWNNESIARPDWNLLLVGIENIGLAFDHIADDVVIVEVDREFWGFIRDVCGWPIARLSNVVHDFGPRAEIVLLDDHLGHGISPR